MISKLTLKVLLYSLCSLFMSMGNATPSFANETASSPLLKGGTWQDNFPYSNQSDGEWYLFWQIIGLELRLGWETEVNILELDGNLRLLQVNSDCHEEAKNCTNPFQLRSPLIPQFRETPFQNFGESLLPWSMTIDLSGKLFFDFRSEKTSLYLLDLATGGGYPYLRSNFLDEAERSLVNGQPHDFFSARVIEEIYMLGYVGELSVSLPVLEGTLTFSKLGFGLGVGFRNTDVRLLYGGCPEKTRNGCLMKEIVNSNGQFTPFPIGVISYTLAEYKISKWKFKIFDFMQGGNLERLVFKEYSQSQKLPDLPFFNLGETTIEFKNHENFEHKTILTAFSLFSITKYF